MKAKLKRAVLPIFLSILSGAVCGRIMYSIYDNKNKEVLTSNIIYLLEDGNYKDYNTMKTKVSQTAYVFYEEEGTFRPVVAMTKDKDNISKIESSYGRKLEITKYILNNKEVGDKIKEYDKIIKVEENQDRIRTLESEIINLYKDKEDIKMTKIS